MLDTRRLDEAVQAHAEHAFALLERLVAQPSTVGQEQGALGVLGEEMRDLGFDVEHLPVPESVLDDPLAGVAQAPYAGRYDLLATRRGPASGITRSLLLNGHIDVVPAQTPQLWTTPPFSPQRRDGRLHGRGAGDMKAGFAMGALAIRALDEVAPDAVTGRLQLLAVIEEECTGHGTLAACRQGVLADAAVLLEPTDLGLLLGGVGVSWFELEVRGRAAHAEAAHLAVNPVELGVELVTGLRAWAAGLAAEHDDPVMADAVSPYNLNLGVVQAGDWASSVPSVATLRVRFGHPRAWSPAEAEKRFAEAVRAVVARHGGFPVEPTVRAAGFRAAGYAQAADTPLVQAVAAAHLDAHGTAPRTYAIGSTTDARYYVNDFDVPALCYGPVAHDIHGIDESVELASVVDGARTLARFLHAWFAPRRAGARQVAGGGW